METGVSLLYTIFVLLVYPHCLLVAVDYGCMPCTIFSISLLK